MSVSLKRRQVLGSRPFGGMIWGFDEVEVAFQSCGGGGLRKSGHGCLEGGVMMMIIWKEGGRRGR